MIDLVIFCQKTIIKLIGQQQHFCVNWLEEYIFAQSTKYACLILNIIQQWQQYSELIISIKRNYNQSIFMLKPSTAAIKSLHHLYKSPEKNIINIPSLKKYLIDEIDSMKQLTENRFRKTQVILEQQLRKPLSGYKKFNGKYQSVDNSMKKFHEDKSKKIDCMSKELKQVILEIQNEERKNSVLKQLTNIIKIEQSKDEKQQTLSQSQLRQIKKIESDIENYGKVTNQLIGNAKNLKQQIYHDRKNRAMFSILFRDLQKQLKIQQNRYKKILIYSNQYGVQQNKRFVDAVQKEGTNNIVSRMNTVRKIQNLCQQTDAFADTGDCFFTELKENDNIGSIKAINFYCSSKKNLALVKPRRDYIGSTKKIIRDSTQEACESYANFIDKMCAVASMNTRKMHDAMGPNGLQSKNSQLYKKIGKINEHIIKYENKIILLQKEINFRQIYPNEEYQTQQQKKVQLQQINNMQKNISQESQKLIQQKKAQIVLNQKIYSQMLYLTNTKKDQTVKLSPDQLSIHLSQQQVYHLLLNKIDIIIESIGIRKQSCDSKSRSPKVRQHESILKSSKPDESIRKKSPCLSIKINTEQSQNQKNLNSILGNIKVYNEYERVFSRMEFQSEYYFQKNKKGKKRGSGLIRK